MTRAFFHVRSLLFLRQTGQQIQCRNTLTGGGNIILAALNGFHSHSGDRTNIHRFSVDGESISSNLAALKDPLDRGQIEFGGHIHHCQIFIIKTVVLVMLLSFATGDTHDLFIESFAVFFSVHGHEALQLQQARVNHTPTAGIFRADLLDHGFFKLPHGYATAEICHLGWCCIRIHWAAYKRQGFWL